MGIGAQLIARPEAELMWVRRKLARPEEGDPERQSLLVREAELARLLLNLEHGNLSPDVLEGPRRSGLELSPDRDNAVPWSSSSWGPSFIDAYGGGNAEVSRPRPWGRRRLATRAARNAVGQDPTLIVPGANTSRIRLRSRV
jgi:hypothetical protein